MSGLVSYDFNGIGVEIQIMTESGVGSQKLNL